MGTSTRIYVVTDLEAQPEEHRLVRAATRAQAIQHVVDRRYVADVANQDTLVDLAHKGLTVEAAGEATTGTSPNPPAGSTQE